MFSVEQCAKAQLSGLSETSLTLHLIYLTAGWMWGMGYVLERVPCLIKSKMNVFTADMLMKWHAITLQQWRVGRCAAVLWHWMPLDRSIFLLHHPICVLIGWIQGFYLFIQRCVYGFIRILFKFWTKRHRHLSGKIISSLTNETWSSQVTKHTLVHINTL